MTHQKMTHSFGFKRIPGLPSGTVLSCFYLSRIRYFGTSTGNLIIRNENQKFSLKDDKIIRLNGPIRSIRGAEGGTEDLLVCLSDFHIFIVLIPKLGSTLKKIKIIEEKVESEFICVGGQETIFFSEGCSIYLGRINSNFGFEKVPFFHSRTKIIQIEQQNSKLLGNRFIQRLNQ